MAFSMDVTIDGRSVTVAPLTNSYWQKIEDQLCKSMFKIQDDMTIKDVNYLLWYAIHKADASFETVEQAVSSLIPSEETRLLACIFGNKDPEATAGPDPTQTTG
jgi:hypothetical protein